MKEGMADLPFVTYMTLGVFLISLLTITLVLYCCNAFWNKVKKVTKRKQSFQLRRLPSLPTKRRSFSRNKEQDGGGVPHWGKAGKASLKKYREQEQSHGVYLVPDVHLKNTGCEYDETVVPLPEVDTPGIYQNRVTLRMEEIAPSNKELANASRIDTDTSFYQNHQSKYMNRSLSHTNDSNRVNSKHTHLPNGRKKAKSFWTKPSAYIMAQFASHIVQEDVHVAQVRLSEEVKKL